MTGRVFLLPTKAIMPALRKGDKDRVLPGGYCPRGMRSQWSSLAGDHRYVPKRAKHDRHASDTWYRMEREFKRGERVYDSAI